jgi:Zn-dependent protease with chaperone function
MLTEAGRTPMSSENAPVKRRVVLTGISSRAWEHPADKGALTALRELRGFDDVLKALSGMWNERAWRLQFLGGAIRADHRQHPRVHRIFAEAAASLDVPALPELFVELSPAPNAQCIGMTKPFIVVTSRAVESLDDEELRHVLGHELGHMGSGHAVYRTMMIILTRLSANLAWLPIGSIALRGIIVALHEWWRKAELSADRAGVLAGQDTSAALRAHMKLAGGGDLSEVDTTAFLEQAAEYESAGDLRDSLIKLQLTTFLTHPLPVARAADLRRWIDSGAYQRILSGDYPRRDGDREASMSGAVKDAADSYRQAFQRSQDPLVGLLRKLGDGAWGLSDVVGAGANRVRGWTNRGNGKSSETPPAGSGDDAWGSASDGPSDRR